MGRFLEVPADADRVGLSIRPTRPRCFCRVLIFSHRLSEHHNLEYEGSLEEQIADSYLLCTSR